MRGKGSGREVEEVGLMPKSRGIDQDTSHYLDIPDSDKKKKKSKGENNEDEDEGWLTGGVAVGVVKSKKAKDKDKNKVTSRTFDTKTPPELDSYRSQYSPDEVTGATHTHHSSSSNTGITGAKGFKVPLKTTTSSSTSAASIYGSAKTTGTSSSGSNSSLVNSKQQSSNPSEGADKDKRIKHLNAVTGTGRPVTVNINTHTGTGKNKGRKRVSESSLDLDNFSEEEDVQILQESDVEDVDTSPPSPKKWDKVKSKDKDREKDKDKDKEKEKKKIMNTSSVTKRRKLPSKPRNHIFNSDSSSDDEDLGFVDSRHDKAGTRRGEQGRSKNNNSKKRDRDSIYSDQDDSNDDANSDRNTVGRSSGGREREAESGKKVVEEPVSLLSIKKQSAFLAWIDAFRKQWDSYWNKLPEVRNSECTAIKICTYHSSSLSLRKIVSCSVMRLSRHIVPPSPFIIFVSLLPLSFSSSFLLTYFLIPPPPSSISISLHLLHTELYEYNEKNAPSD